MSAESSKAAERTRVEKLLEDDLLEVRLRIFDKYGIEFVDFEPEERTKIFKDTFNEIINEKVN